MTPGDPPLTLAALRRRLKELSSHAHAEVLQRFFKTGPGEYGEGDVFSGIRQPDLRKVARASRELPIHPLRALLQSKVHEERMLALLILVLKFERGSPAERGAIYRLYMGSTRHINSWDLVDATAPHVVGAYLAGRDKTPLRELAASTGIWKRRIAIVATHRFIRRWRYGETLRIARMLLHDPEDLIHKAVGWMLREVGKRDEATLDGFLSKHCRTMPRTMLRYAIERMPEKKRKAYMAGKIEGA